MSKQENSANQFASFYRQQKESDTEILTFIDLAKEQKFAQTMKAGKTKQMIEWRKIIYGVLGVAMVAKGISIIEKM